MKSTVLRNISLGVLSVLFVFSAVYGFSGWQGVENANTGDTITATVWNNLVNGLVKGTGSIAETITGIKTFSDSPIVPSPTASGEVASKGYVDSNSSGGSAKNYIINGNFNIWQRRTNFSNPNQNYTADRWKGLGGFGNTITYSRQSFALGQTDVPGAEYYIYMNKTAGSAANPELEQQIEDVTTLEGEISTLSFYAKANSARDLIIHVNQYFGDGGSPSSTVQATNQTVNLTTSRQKFTLNFTPPSLSGKTLGTNNNDYLQLEFRWGDNSNGNISIAKVQVEKGSTASDFEYRTLAEELALCQRYFTKTFATNVAPAHNVGNAGVLPFLSMGTTSGASYGIVSRWEFPTTMRTIPTISKYTPRSTNTAGNAMDIVNGGVFTEKSVSINNTTDTQVTFQISVQTNLGNAYGVHATADAELY